MVSRIKKKYKGFIKFAVQSRKPFFELAKEYISKGSRILDIGAGNGEFAEMVSGYEVYLFEGNEHSSKELRKRFRNVVCEPFSGTLPYRNDFFNMVHCSHFVEHFNPDNVYALIKEIDRTLMVDGYFIISAPLLNADFYNDLSHVRVYNPDVFIRYLASDKTENYSHEVISNNYEIIKLVYRYKFKRCENIIAFEKHPTTNKFLFILSLLARRLAFGKYEKSGYTLVMQKKKIKFIDSSNTWYGIARQLENHINNDSPRISKSISICYANDLGLIRPEDSTPRSPSNSVTLRRAINSRADIVFYSQKACSKWFERKNCFYIPSGIDNKIFKPMGIQRSVKVGFVGNNCWPRRDEFLKKLRKNFGKQFVMKNGIYMQDVALFYNKCNIVANHSVVDEINMRMFEATACGALLITQRVPYLEDFWELGSEIVIYEKLEEMIDKIIYFLAHENERTKIALAGQKRTLLEHTYEKRAKIAKAHIEELFSITKEGI